MLKRAIHVGLAASEANGSGQSYERATRSEGQSLACRSFNPYELSLLTRMFPSRFVCSPLTVGVPACNGSRARERVGDNKPCARVELLGNRRSLHKLLAYSVELHLSIVPCNSLQLASLCVRVSPFRSPTLRRWAIERPSVYYIAVGEGIRSPVMLV